RRSKMKKVMLVTLVLAFCGVLHNSVLAQVCDITSPLCQRYLVTYVSSSAIANNPRWSATAVMVVNQSFGPCDVKVEWFSNGIGGTPASPSRCPLRATVDGGTPRSCV